MKTSNSLPDRKQDPLKKTVLSFKGKDPKQPTRTYKVSKDEWKKDTSIIYPDKTQEELDKILDNRSYATNPRHIFDLHLNRRELLKDLTHYINKYYVPKGDLEDPSVSNEVGGNQAVDPILVSEMFKMVYQWGRVGVVVDSSAPAFQEQLKEVIRSIK